MTKIYNKIFKHLCRYFGENNIHPVDAFEPLSNLLCAICIKGGIRKSSLIEFIEMNYDHIEDEISKIN